MQFLKSPIGKKIVMAMTGFGMLGFVIIHGIGNSTIYFGRLNAYAAHLHAFPPLMWTFRVGMLVLLVMHAFFGIRLSLENSAAKPSTYAVRTYLGSTIASRNMIWTGVLAGCFLVYHLLHFTFQVTDPAISAVLNPDPFGRPDVFKMVVLSFQRPLPVAVYIATLVVLAFHLSHGIQSFFQTLGLNNDRTLPVFRKAGIVAAAVVFLGFAAIPIVILLGIVK